MLQLTPILTLAFLVMCSFIPKIKGFQTMFTLYGMPHLFYLQVFVIDGLQICYARLVRENIIAKLGSVSPEQQKVSHHSAVNDSRPQEPVIKPRGNAGWKY